jgi:hypothetical protein
MAPARSTLLPSVKDKALEDLDDTTVSLPLTNTKVADAMCWKLDTSRLHNGSLVFRKDGTVHVLYRGMGIVEDHRLGPYGHQTEDYFWKAVRTKSLNL